MNPYSIFFIIIIALLWNEISQVQPEERRPMSKREIQRAQVCGYFSLVLCG